MKIAVVKIYSKPIVLRQRNLFIQFLIILPRDAMLVRYTVCCGLCLSVCLFVILIDYIRMGCADGQVISLILGKY